MNHDLQNSELDHSQLMRNAMEQVSPTGPWHTVKALETGTVIGESKDGAYGLLQEADVLVA